MPEAYQIRIKGKLDDVWMTTFSGMVLKLLENGDTLLSGTLADQPALHGVLEIIRDLNLTLISVTSCSEPESMVDPENS